MNNIFGLSPSEHFNLKVFLFYFFSWRVLISVRKRVQGLIRNVFCFFTLLTLEERKIVYCTGGNVKTRRVWAQALPSTILTDLESKFVFWPTTICFALKISRGNYEVEPYFKIQCFCFTAFYFGLLIITFVNDSRRMDSDSYWQHFFQCWHRKLVITYLGKTLILALQPFF